MQHLSKYLLVVIAFGSVSVSAQDEPLLPERSFGGTSAAKTKEIFLVRDMPQTITFDYEVGEIAVGNPDVVAVVADRPRRRVVLSPLREGETALLVFDTGGKQRDNIQIFVTSTDLDQFVKDLRFLFRDIEGLSYRRVGRKIVVEGEVYLKTDLDRIKEVVQGNEFVVNLVTLSQDTQRILARRIKDEIGIAGVEVVTVKDRIVLKGEVATEDEAQRAEKIAGIYTDKGSIVNVIAVNPKKASAKAARLIQVTAYFVELNKSFLRQFQFKWAPLTDVSTTFAASSRQGALIDLQAIVSGFLPSLNTAKALGLAKVFENPTVTVKSGESATVSTGGSIFVPVQSVTGGNQNAPIELKTILSVTPAADDRDFIDLKATVDVTKLGASISAGGAESPPTIQTINSKVETSQYLRSGETVALGGIMRTSHSDYRDTPPGSPFALPGSEGGNSFGNLFQIFKGRDISQNRSMMIVFVTPEILVSPRDSNKFLRDQMNLQQVDPRATGQLADSLE